MARRTRGEKVLSTTLALTLALGQVLAPSFAYADETAQQAAVASELTDPLEAQEETTPLVAQAESFTIGQNGAPIIATTSLPILKGAGFDFMESVFGIDAGTMPDGTKYWSIGIDQKNNALLSDLINGKTTVWDKAQASFINTGTRDNKFSFKPAWKVSALYKEKGELKSGELVILGGVTGKKEGQYIVFTGEASMMGTLGLKVPWYYRPGQVRPEDDFDAGLALNGSLSVKLAGGLGVAYIGRVGFYGQALSMVELQVLPRRIAGWNKAQLKADIGVEVVALGYRVWHLDIWNGGPWDLFTPRNPQLKPQSDFVGPVLTAANEYVPMVVPQSNYVAVPIDYAGGQGSWQGFEKVVAPYPYMPDEAESGSDDPVYDSYAMTNEYSTPQEGMRVLQTNVYPDTSVQVVDSGDSAVMCWIAGTDIASGGTRLMWSRHEKGKDTWSAPRSVRPAGSVGSDYEPCLFSDDKGTVHVAWLGSEGSAEGDTSFEAKSSRMSVRYATLERGASDFSAPELVAQANNKVKTTPKVAAVGDQVICGWTEIDHANLTNYAGRQNVVWARRQQAGGWEATQIHQTDEVTSLAAGVIGDIPCVAWTEANLTIGEYGDVSSTTPVLKVKPYGSDVAEYAKNARNVGFAQERGKGVLTWSEADGSGQFDLMALGAVGGTPHRVFDNANLPPIYQVEGDLADDALFSYSMWESDPDGSADKSTMDIYGMAVVDATLSDEALLVAHKDDLTSHNVAYVGGRPVVVAAAERGVGSGHGLRAMSGEVESRNADLLVAVGDALERITIDGAYYDAGQIVPGAKVPVTVRVYNSGLDTIDDGLKATIVDDTTGKVIGEGQLVKAIEPGDYGDVQVIMQVPADMQLGSSRQISIKANFLNGTAQAQDSIALNIDATIMYEAQSVPAGFVPTQGTGFTGGISSWTGGTSYASTTSGTESTAPVRRIFGPDRYATMQQAVSSAFDHSDWAVLASGADYPDALSALALAGAHRGPVVLTAPDALSPQAAEELRRLGCTNLVCVGGPAAVSDAVLDQARGIVGSVTRVSGDSRYETSLAAFREARAASSSSDTVILATGSNFADALSAGPWSWRTVAPVVLVKPDGTLTAEAVEQIRTDAGIKRVVIMGGEAAVSESVRTQLGDGYEYVRLAGADRYQTSAAAAQWFCAHGLTWDRPYVATGTGFADALAAAAVAGAGSAPLVLVNPNSQDAPSAISAHREDIREVTIVGGTSAVGASAEGALRSALR